MNLSYEQEHWQKGKAYIVGIDEVGRGCLAGPVVAAAVVFSDNHNPIALINDSKKLSEQKRELLFPLIQQQALFYGIGEGSVQEINEQGIVPATALAMQRALAQIDCIDHIFLDGNRMLDIGYSTEQVTTIVKGDSKVYSIAAASIIAKVYRDQYMKQLAETYPIYRFEKHKGYGTKIHREVIASHGISPIHRTLFCRNILV